MAQRAAVAGVPVAADRATRKPKSGTRRRVERLLGDVGVRVALVVFVVWTLAPVAWMLISSLLHQVALTSLPPDLSLGQFTLDNYRGVLATGQSLVPALRNSLAVSLLTTGIALVLGSAAAYAIARLSVPGGNSILLMVLATQMFPGIVIIIPLFIVLSQVGLIDTYAGLVVVYLSFVLPIVIWILKGFFEAIPPELEKAAAIDGASTLQTFTRIVLPISLPPLFATGIFAFIESWNEFMFAIILTRLHTKTVPIAISEFAGQYQTAVGQMVAAATLASVPVIVLAVVFRKYILMGFAEGAIKG
jgi:multiple sugar transport system permease protein